MTWMDCTLPVVSGMPVWPGDPEVDIEIVATLEKDGVRLARLHLGTHTGTHMDAPLHFLSDGVGVDRLSLDVLIGPCRVLDLGDSRHPITEDDIARIAPESGERLLFRTSNRLADAASFREDYVAFSPQAAAALAAAGVVLVGIDGPSADSFHAVDHPAHSALLGAGVVIVEGIDLRRVEPGSYDLVALPLRLEGLDGSPARVAVRRSETQPGFLRSTGDSSTV